MAKADFYDTIHYALLAYFHAMKKGENKAVQLLIHDEFLDFHLYKLPNNFTITSSNINNLFPLLITDDGPIQVLMCENLIIEKNVVCTPPAAAKACCYGVKAA